MLTLKTLLSMFLLLTLKACNFIKEETLAQVKWCFPVNFAKLSRRLFFIEHLWWLLLS